MRFTLATPSLATSASRPSTIDELALSASMSTIDGRGRHRPRMALAGSMHRSVAVQRPQR
jgi:hypothetical protein